MKCVSLDGEVHQTALHAFLLKKENWKQDGQKSDESGTPFHEIVAAYSLMKKNVKYL